MRKTNGAPAKKMSAFVPAVVARATAGPGQSLDGPTRLFMEQRFHYDFGGVRLHTDGAAAMAARSIYALAFTLGNDVVFAHGQPATETAAGRRLLAHELTHVIQQRSGARAEPGHGVLGAPDSAHERQADDTAERVVRGEPFAPIAAVGHMVVQRTLLCSKPLEAPVVGWYARHAFVDDTATPTCNNPGALGNYAVTDLIGGNFVRGCAVKTSRSPDPRNKPTLSKPCTPKAGVADLHRCLRDAYNLYTDPSLYSNVAVTVGAAGGAVIGGATGASQGAEIGALFGVAGAVIGGVIGGLWGAIRGARTGAALTSRWNGPNSNTFAATLARACCTDASDAGLGWVPGWQHEPAGPCSGSESDDDTGPVATTALSTVPTSAESGPVTTAPPVPTSVALLVLGRAQRRRS